MKSGRFLTGLGGALAAAIREALLLDYFGAPAGENALATYTPGRAYDTTLKIAATSNPDLSFRPGVSAASERFFAGLPFLQGKSSHVRGALTISRRYARAEYESYGPIPSGDPDRSTMIAMYHPRIEILGDPARPRYRFVPGPSDSNGSSFLVTSVAQLGTDFGLAALTVASFKAQVVTDPSELVAPRFSFQGTRRAPFEISSSPDFVVTQTDAVSSAASTIVDSTGFAPGPLADALAVGNTLDVQYFGLSEDRSAKLVSLSVEANGDASLQDIYWDAVFRTWILLERT